MPLLHRGLFCSTGLGVDPGGSFPTYQEARAELSFGSFPETSGLSSTGLGVEP